MSHPPIPEEAFMDADWFDSAWVPEGWTRWRSGGNEDVVLASALGAMAPGGSVQALWTRADQSASVTAYLPDVSATLKVARHRVADAGHLVAAMATALAACRRGLQ